MNPFSMVNRTPVSAPCPQCGATVAATVTTYPNVEAPRGQRPMGLDYDHDCPGLQSRDSFTALDCALYDAFEELERTAWPATPYDRKEDRF